MIKAVVLDVDGVIVGDQKGVNFPYPNENVIGCLKKVRESGVFVCLCTGKSEFSVEKIIRDAHLNNLHVTDGGAVVSDPLDRKVSFQHVMPRRQVIEMVHFYNHENVYQEFYPVIDYYVRKRQRNKLTEKHAEVLQKWPQMLEDIEVERLINNTDLVKIFLMAKDRDEKESISQSFSERFAKDLTLSWTINPNTMPWHYGVVTAKGISKRKGVEQISQHLGVPFENILGIGDTMHDWQFIELCGYGAAMGTGSEEFKNLVLSKGSESGFAAKSVNEDGIIEVMKHFNLH